MNQTRPFLFNLICFLAFFFHVSAESKVILQWFADFKNRKSDTPTVCEYSFKNMFFSDSLHPIQLEDRMRDTELYIEPIISMILIPVFPTILRQKQITYSPDHIKIYPTVYILNSAGKKIGIFKREGRSLENPFHEIATYELCVAIGCRVVPPTEYIRFQTETGSFQEFVEGIARFELSPQDLKVYIQSLQNLTSTLRKDFDEMVILDLIGGASDRNASNYIIDINKGRLYAIDHSEFFSNDFRPNMHWIIDAKRSQIWQAQISKRMRQIITQIDFSKIQYIFSKYRFNSKQKKHIRERIKKLQQIIRENPEITLESIVEEMGNFYVPSFISRSIGFISQGI